MNIKVINYKTGNISSVVSALGALGLSSEVVTDASSVEIGDVVVLPGVGSFNRAAENLINGGFYEYDFSARENKVIGICLGFHLMCMTSEEGDSSGLGLFNARVSDFRGRVNPPLNLGWSNVDSEIEAFTQSHYFCHRYYVEAQKGTKALIHRDGLVVSNVMNQGRYWGVQSHPERSGARGLRLLREMLCNEP